VSATITNAIADALGCPIDHTPTTPQQLFDLTGGIR
jgi:CO/xanthine dehydrogenase Mo-binding subunit